MRNVFQSYVELLGAPAEANVPPAVVPERPDERACRCDAQALRSVRFFHAAVKERIDDAVRQLCEDIAANVLARELQLAPCDIRLIVQRALDVLACEEPVRVRVHPAESCVHLGEVTVVADDSLLPGDAIVEVRRGTVDVSLGCRLESVLREFRA